MRKKEIWEEHDIVFHYTDQAGLKGILSSQELHATHFKYLNDPTEMVHMEPYLASAIQPFVWRNLRDFADSNSYTREAISRHGGLECAAEHEARTLVSSVYNVTFGIGREQNYFDPYVISFCAHADEYERNNGLLSQWRGYGKASGYALVFDTKRLVKETKPSPDWDAFMGDVVYEGDQAKFRSEFASLLSKRRAL